MTFPINVTPAGPLILTSPVVVSNGTVNGGGGGGGLDPATTAYINAIGTAGGSVSSGRQTLFDNFITSLKSGGVFAKAERMFLLANEATINGRVDIVTGAVATLHGTMTFTADHGFAGDGSTGYLDTGFNPTGASLWSLNSGALGVYTRTSRGVGADMCNVGAQSDGSHSDFYPMWSDGNMYARVNGSGSVAGALSGSNAQGMFVTSLGASGARFVRKNGAAYATQTDNPTAVPNFTFLIGATHTAGAPASFSTDENAFVFIGGGLTTTEADALASAVNTYMTAIGANVY